MQATRVYVCVCADPDWAPIYKPKTLIGPPIID